MPAKPDYRVTVVRRGGFAGVPMTFEADTATLSDAGADALRRLVESCGRRPRAGAGRADAAGRDLVEWSVRVRGTSGGWSVRGREDTLDPAVARLIEAIRGLA